MRLRIQRSQRKGGVFGGKIYFMLDVRAEYTAQERSDIQKYDLGGEVVYNSQAARKHWEAVGQKLDGGGVRGVVGGLGSLALAKMNLNITIASLANGHHIECRDLGELSDAEDAMVSACKALRHYLALAASFNGTEVVVDFAEDEPAMVSTPQLEGNALQQQLPPPSAPITVSQPTTGLTTDRRESLFRS